MDCREAGRPGNFLPGENPPARPAAPRPRLELARTSALSGARSRFRSEVQLSGERGSPQRAPQPAPSPPEHTSEDPAFSRGGRARAGRALDVAGSDATGTQAWPSQRKIMRARRGASAARSSPGGRGSCAGPEGTTGRRARASFATFLRGSGLICLGRLDPKAREGRCDRVRAILGRQKRVWRFQPKVPADVRDLVGDLEL